MDLLARVLFLLFCHLTSLAKQIVFHTSAVEIEEMVDDFDDPLYSQTDAQGQHLLKETSRNATRLVTCYYSTAIVTCTLWILFPMIDHYQGKHVEFFFWKSTLDGNKPVMFELFLAYSYYVTSLVGIANTTMDAFMGTILYQSKTQMRILRLNLEKLPDKCRQMSNGSENFNDNLFIEFKLCLQHYQKIHKTTKHLQEIFGLAILFQFTVGGWILCMAAYKVVDLNLLSMEFISMCLFIFCILVELFIYCYYGNEVYYESENLMRSIYAMNWLMTPVNFRKSLVIMMERAKKPLKPTAGGLIPLSLDTFVRILKSSYTFYAVLRQTK